MNPFAYKLREQAKALAAGLTALGTGLAAGNVAAAIVGALVAFYGVFAMPNQGG